MGAPFETDPRTDFEKLLINKKEVYVRFEVNNIEQASKIIELVLNPKDPQKLGATGVHWNLMERQAVSDLLEQFNLIMKKE